MSLIVIGVVIGAFFLLLLTNKAPEIILGGALLLLMLAGAVSVKGGLSGFSNPGLITIAALYVVAAGLRESGALWPLLNNLLRNAKTSANARARLVFPVALISAFVNNTPIVAALIPSVARWCKNAGRPRSSFLLPLSYAAILGGTCSLIGTSTNLLVYGFLQQRHIDFGFFEIAWVGLPVAVCGLLFLVLFGGKLLPSRERKDADLTDTREYTVEMLVEAEGPLVGKSIEAGGLRHLKGLYLIEILREDMVIPAVSPDTLLHANDRLIFTGLVNSISELLAIKGLISAESQVFKLEKNAGRFKLIEVVIGARNPVVGKTVKQCFFRRLYGAAVIAVVREGRRIEDKVGNIRIKAGDTFLLMAPKSFIEKYKVSVDFMILSHQVTPFLAEGKRAMLAWLSLAALLLLAGSGLVPVVVAALLSAIMMVGFRCVDLESAKRSIDLQVVLIIASAFGLGQAMTESGAARLVGELALSLADGQPLLLLVAVYLLTLVLTELITNSAAAVIAFSLSSGVVESLGMNLTPFAVAIMIAASASFISPLGYQTNLMVYSAGGYRFRDFARIGIPLSILVGAIALSLIPLIWPLGR